MRMIMIIILTIRIMPYTALVAILARAKHKQRERRGSGGFAREGGWVGGRAGRGGGSKIGYIACAPLCH